MQAMVSKRVSHSADSGVTAASQFLKSMWSNLYHSDSNLCGIPDIHFLGEGECYKMQGEDEKASNQPHPSPR